MISVQCMACQEPGTALAPWSYEIPPEPPEGQLDVDISHCGVCGSDVHQIDNSWGVACFPLVPGHEIIGTVVRLGPGVDSFQLGQRVGIGVQRSCCGQCACCNAGLEQICPAITKTYAGPGKDKGGFARRIRYTARWTFAVPDTLPSELAAPLMCAGITTFSPLKRHCKAGMRVGIIGVGGLGHIAVQYARAMGCVVVAISTSEAKRAEALELGAADYLCSQDAGQMSAAKSSLDVILNTASGVAGLDSYLALLKPRGVMVCVGLPEKEVANMTKLFMHSLVLQEKSIAGSYLGPYADYGEMLAFSAAQGIKPMVETFRLEDANTALARVKSGTARYRTVLRM